MIKPRIMVTGATGKTGSVVATERTFGNWIREFAQFMIAPLAPGFNLDRYDRELRRPFPSQPQFAPESAVWRREHGIVDAAKLPVPGNERVLITATSRGQRLEF